MLLLLQGIFVEMFLLLLSLILVAATTSLRLISSGDIASINLRKASLEDVSVMPKASCQIRLSQFIESDDLLSSWTMRCDDTKSSSTRVVVLEVSCNSNVPGTPTQHTISFTINSSKNVANQCKMSAKVPELALFVIKGTFERSRIKRLEFRVLQLFHGRQHGHKFLYNIFPYTRLGQKAW